MAGQRPHPFRARLHTTSAASVQGHGRTVSTPVNAPCDRNAAPVQGVRNDDASPRDGAAASRNDPSAAAWERADEAAKARARARLRSMQRSHALSSDGMPQGQADAHAAAEAGVSVSSLAAWRRRVAGLPGEARVRALLEGTRTGRPSTVDANAEWAETLEALIYHGGPHLTAEHARRTLIVRTGSAPALRTIRDWIARRRKTCARSISAVTDPDGHRSGWKPAFGDGEATIEGLNALWELDSTIADVICADGRRHALIAAIDIWSRRTRFLVTATSRAVAIAALTRRCIIDWGVPAAVRTDEGADYTSDHYRGVLEDLEIGHIVCPPYTPEAKPFVERLIGTVARDLFAHLPDFSGHNPADASRLRSKKSFSGRRGESPVVTFRADLTPEELQTRLDAWADSLYGRRPHGGLGDMSPFAKAASWTGDVHTISDIRALDALMAVPASNGGTRVVAKKGIKVGGAYHIAAELGALVKTRVGVRLDATDAGRIHVYAPDGTFICIAEDPMKTGLDRAEVAARAKALSAREDASARKRARRLAKERKPETAMDDALGRATQDAGRVVAMPRRSREHETPALAAAGKAAEAAEQPADRAASDRRHGMKSAAGGTSRSVMDAMRRHYLEEDL